MEAYGLLQADPEKVHGENWRVASDHAEDELQKILPRDLLDKRLEETKNALSWPSPLIAAGSGWAALELMRLGKADRFDGEAAVFPKETLTRDQEPWVELLEKGSFPNQPVDEAPASYLTQPDWIPLLTAAIQRGSDHWHAHLQLGVMLAANGEMDKARDEFIISGKLAPNGWAKRNLAVLLSMEGCIEEASHLLLEAAAMLPIRPVAIECGKALLEAKRYADFPDFYDSLPETAQRNGRIQIMRAQAAAMLDDFDLCLDILNSGIQFADIREGEVSLSDLWILLHARKIAKAEGIEVDSALKERALAENPIPKALDFRMRT
jgi:tetratricopeptide (TPR) repeat protein